jgi:hypothetical protein
MNAPALPAYLQNRQSQGVAARATSGMGGVLPPHISIAGNCFTLIDAGGNKMPLGGTMQACVVDICDHLNKRYYENDWTPGSDEPPTCFSRNGVSPSRDAQTPQARFCTECEWNKRGSDTSKLSNKPIKACRDEKDIALLLPQYPNMLFQLTLPPGSFKNWTAYMTNFKGGADVSDVLTHFGFQMQANGVMTFQPVMDQHGYGVYIPEALAIVREQALASKATDVLVGRNDVPIALPAPTNEQRSVGSGVAPTHPQAPPAHGAQAQFGGQPQAQAPFGAGQMTAAQRAVTGQQATPPSAPNAAPAGATTEPAKPQRIRRTRDQIAADNAAKAAQAGSAPSQGSAPVQPQAPFPVQQPGTAAFGAAPAAPQGTFGQPGQTMGQPGSQQPTFGQPAAAPAGNGGSFGIQPGADPNVDPQLAAMLAGLGT